MVKHMILWKIRDDLQGEALESVKRDVKLQLESLKGKIEGLLDITVQIEGLATSNADMMLDSSFENEEALAAYATHPEHVFVADTYVRPYTVTRLCLDFEV